MNFCSARRAPTLTKRGNLSAAAAIAAETTTSWPTKSSSRQPRQARARQSHISLVARSGLLDQLRLWRAHAVHRFVIAGVAPPNARNNWPRSCLLRDGAVESSSKFARLSSAPFLLLASPPLPVGRLIGTGGNNLARPLCSHRADSRQMYKPALSSIDPRRRRRGVGGWQFSGSRSQISDRRSRTTNATEYERARRNRVFTVGPAAFT